MPDVSISIIVPVFNVEGYVEDCLRSVMRQTYTGPMECIIVDDCGTDNSMQIVERLVTEYEGPIDFKVLHYTHNQGHPAARNTGIDAASGDYLFFLDSDDVLTDNCISSLWDKASLDPSIEIVQGNTKTLPEEDPDILHKEYLVTHATNNKEVRSCFYHSEQFTVYAWNKLISRAFLLRYNLKFNNLALAEDLLWVLFVLQHATNVYFDSNITYLYKRHENSLTTNANKADWAKAFFVVYKEILDHPTPNYEKEEYFYFCTRFLGVYLDEYIPEYDESFRLFWKKAYRFAPKSYYFLILVYLLRKSTAFSAIVHALGRAKRSFKSICNRKHDSC